MFNNIDALPLGKLLQISYGSAGHGKKKSSNKKKLNVTKLLEKGFK